MGTIEKKSFMLSFHDPIDQYTKRIVQNHKKLSDEKVLYGLPVKSFGPEAEEHYHIILNHTRFKPSVI